MAPRRKRAKSVATAGQKSILEFFTKKGEIPSSRSLLCKDLAKSPSQRADLCPSSPQCVTEALVPSTPPRSKPPSPRKTPPPTARCLDFSQFPVTESSVDRYTMNFARTSSTVIPESLGDNAHLPDSKTEPSPDLEEDVSKKFMALDCSQDEFNPDERRKSPARESSLQLLVCEESSLAGPAPTQKDTSVVDQEADSEDKAPPNLQTAVDTAQVLANNDDLQFSNVDRDGDSLMGLPEGVEKDCTKAPESPKPDLPGDSPRNSTTDVDRKDEKDNAMSDSSSDSDSDDDILAQLAEATQPVRNPPRRSARISEGINPPKKFEDTTEPKEAAFRGSVFRTGPKSRRISCANTKLEEIVRNRNRREANQKKLDELRQDLAGTSATELDDSEKMFAEYADAENEQERQRVEVLHKYESPLPFFVGNVDMPTPNRAHERRTKNPKHPLHDIFSQLSEISLRQTKDRPPLSSLASANDFALSRKSFPPAFVLEYLIQQTLFDQANVQIGCFTRRSEMKILLKDLPNSLNTTFPSMSSILRCYGADFSSSELKECSNPDSIDYLFLNESASKPETASIYERNLKRAFALWTSCVVNRVPMTKLVSPSDRKDHGLSEDANCALDIFLLCIRVLLSPIGDKLVLDIALFFEVVLDRIDSEQWGAFRQRAALLIVDLTSRLGLHHELFSARFPMRTARARHLGLDASFLSLCQWCAGPAANPVPAEVHGVWSRISGNAPPSDLSYTLGDVLDAMKKIPELGKTTDVVWACGLACILKQVIVEHDVLSTRREGDLAKIVGLLKKMRACSHRMAFGIPVEDMRLALDGLLAAVKGLSRFDKKLQKELNPLVRSAPLQQDISKMLS